MNTQIYREELLENYKNPLNNEKIENAEHREKLENLSCGDSIEIFINTKDNKISDIGFLGEGCAITIAAASIISEAIKELNIQEITNLDYSFVEDLIGMSLSPSRKKCAHLPLLTIQKALAIKKS